MVWVQQKEIWNKMFYYLLPIFRMLEKMGFGDHLFQYYHFTDEKMETQRRKITCLRFIEMMRTVPWVSHHAGL